MVTNYVLFIFKNQLELLLKCHHGHFSLQKGRFLVLFILYPERKGMYKINVHSCGLSNHTVLKICDDAKIAFPKIADTCICGKADRNHVPF